VPSQDVVLGLYYTTRERINGKGEGLMFADTGEVQRAFDAGEVGTERTHQRALDRMAPKTRQLANSCAATKLSETTAGRALLSEILAEGPAFRQHQQGAEEEGNLASSINVSFRKCGLKETVVFADKLLQSGFPFGNQGGHFHLYR